jgi:Fe2+ transport system protein FeoA
MAVDRIVALSGLKPSQRGQVVTIKTVNVQDLQKLMQAGVLPDACVNVLHQDGSHVLFFANHKEIAVDHEIASRIYVGVSG